MKSTLSALSLTLFTLFLGTFFFLFGCSGLGGLGSDDTPKTPVPFPKDRFSSMPQRDDGDVVVTTTSRLPWELWPLSRDLSGKPLKNSSLLEGDELVRAGRKYDALPLYSQAKKISVTPEEKESSIIRLASTHLAVDKGEVALDILSEYFKSIRQNENEVDERFAIIFAYAYGSIGDIDQSFAWFSKIHRSTAGLGPVADAAQWGVSSLARALKTENLDAASRNWSGDAFISRILALEKRRRSYSSYKDPERENVARFWEIESSRDDSIVTTNGAALTNLGIFLPLSGRYAKLGTSTKQGVELALLGAGGEQSGIQPLFKDTLGDSLEASAAAREVVAYGNTPMIVGPLLSDVATAVSRIVAPEGVGVLALSKRSSFTTGNGVFRLGPTLESQVESLLDVAIRAKGIRRYAIVAPNNMLGEHHTTVFQDYAYRNNVEVIYTGRYTSGSDASLVKLVGEVQRLEIDGLFFPGSVEEAARFLTNIPIHERKNFTVLGLGTWDNFAKIRRSKTVLEGILFVSPFFASSDRPVVKKFNEAFKRKYGSTPDFLAAQGFDAATLISSALKRATREGIDPKTALSQIEVYDGLTGEIQVTPTGELTRRFSVVELYRGRLREVDIPTTEEQRTPSQETFTLRGNDRVQ